MPRSDGPHNCTLCGMPGHNRRACTSPLESRGRFTEPGWKPPRRYDLEVEKERQCLMCGRPPVDSGIRCQFCGGAIVLV